MSEDQFTKLFKYMQKEFSHVRADIGFVREDVMETKAAVAELNGKYLDNHQELVLLNRKVDRMERWIHEIAQEAGVKSSLLKNNER